MSHTKIRCTISLLSEDINKADEFVFNKRDGDDDRFLADEDLGKVDGHFLYARRWL